MLARVATCATVLSVFVSGCGLAHERAAEIPAPMADAASPDAATPDSGVIRLDAGPLESCAVRWITLPWCPADPASLLGQRCTSEGLECGTHCCEPGPAITCAGGVWVAASAPECRGVDCVGPIPCGTGSCARGSVCLHPSSEIREPDRCVVPPFVMNACGDAPAGWLTSEPRSCEQCLCGDAHDLEISLECACCDR